MTLTLAVVLALAVLVGVSLGLLGGGGSILTVPLLVYVAGMPTKEAITASLFVVGVTSVAGAIGHARAGRVEWRTGLVFGAAGMAGAFAGGLLGGYIPGDVLMVAFALMMVATAAAMIRGRKNRSPEKAHEGRKTGRIIIDGVVVGLVTGLVGAGGGFLVVPALTLLGGLSMSAAVGTSLLVIAMKSFAGLGGYLTSVQLDWPLVLGVTAAAVVGSVLGGRLVGRVPEAALRKGFGWFVLVMGGFVLVRQGPGWAPEALAVAAAAGLVLAGACFAFVRSCPLRRTSLGSRLLPTA